MSCGCKNKSNQPQQNVQPQQGSQPQTTNNSIQESIKKVVEKYYKKK